MSKKPDNTENGCFLGGKPDMAIHQLVLFWRDEEARCFTAWHFQPALQERASQRAHRIINAVSQLSQLQIYGAVLDTSPFKPIYYPHVAARYCFYMWLQRGKRFDTHRVYQCSKKQPVA